MFCIVLVELLSRRKSLCGVLRCINHNPSISHLASSWQWIVFMDGIIILELYVIFWQGDRQAYVSSAGFLLMHNHSDTKQNLESNREIAATLNL